MLGSNIGIDLGTTTTKIFVEGKGIVLIEPSTVAFSADGSVKAMGKKAYEMSEKNPEDVSVVFPVVNGVVSDFTATKLLLQYFLSRICKNMVFKPNIVVCVPSGVTALEKRTILDLITASGAARACLIEEPLAAALGAGVGPETAKGTMIVDIGGGTTDIAVITRGCISISKSIKVAGNVFDEAIIRQIRRERDIIIGRKTAENVKKRIGSATIRETELACTEKGKNYITNLPVTLEINSTELYLAMRPHLEAILDAVKDVLSQLPPELSADIAESGIKVTGGGGLIRGIDRMFSESIGVPVSIPGDCINCVALGTGKALSDMNILEQNGSVFKVRAEIGLTDEY